MNTKNVHTLFPQLYYLSSNSSQKLRPVNCTIFLWSFDLGDLVSAIHLLIVLLVHPNNSAISLFDNGLASIHSDRISPFIFTLGLSHLLVLFTIFPILLDKNNILILRYIFIINFVTTFITHFSPCSILVGCRYVVINI